MVHILTIIALLAAHLPMSTCKCCASQMQMTVKNADSLGGDALKGCSRCQSTKHHDKAEPSGKSHLKRRCDCRPVMNVITYVAPERNLEFTPVLTHPFQPSENWNHETSGAQLPAALKPYSTIPVEILYRRMLL